MLEKIAAMKSNEKVILNTLRKSDPGHKEVARTDELFLKQYGASDGCSSLNKVDMSFK